MFNEIFTESVETRFTTHYLCYGDGVKPKYEAYIGHSPMKKVYPVGSTTKSITWESGQYILYATGKWFKTAVPFIGSQDPDTMLSVKREQVEGFYQWKQLNFNQMEQMPRSQDLEPKIPRNRLWKYNCQLSESRQDELLAFDYQLNAQGIKAWLDRLV